MWHDFHQTSDGKKHRPIPAQMSDQTVTSKWRFLPFIRSVYGIFTHISHKKTTKCNYTVHASYDPLYDTCKNPQSTLAFGNLHLNKLWFLEEKLEKTWIPIPMVETKNLVLDLLEVVGKKTKGWFTGGFPW